MRLRDIITGLIAIVMMSGCTLSNRNTMIPATPIVPTDVPVESTEVAAVPDSGPVVIDGWEVIAPGLDWRIMRYSDSTSIEIAVLRVDPSQFTFRAHYQPGEAYRLADWQERLGDPVAVINANFFDPEDNALGLVVLDGLRYGFSYTDRGGTFLIQNGVPDIRSNIYARVGNEEVVEQAVQAFPMLMLNGQQAYYDESRQARRTAIAQDANGHVLLIATVRGGTTLAGLSAFLTVSDLNIVDALNLDGGGSTMIGVKWPGFAYGFYSYDPVPVVLAVYPR